MIHVEGELHRAMCGVAVSPGSGRMRIDQDTWLEDPSQVQLATCPECLLKLFMLGDSATIALRRMGMTVDVRNEEEIQ